MIYTKFLILLVFRTLTIQASQELGASDGHVCDNDAGNCLDSSTFLQQPKGFTFLSSNPSDSITFLQQPKGMLLMRTPEKVQLTLSTSGEEEKRQATPESKKMLLHPYKEVPPSEVGREGIMAWLSVLAFLILWGPFRILVTQQGARFFPGVNRRPSHTYDAFRDCQGLLEPAVRPPDVSAHETLCQLLLVGKPTAERNVHTCITGVAATQTWNLAELRKLMVNPCWAQIACQSCVVLSMPPGPDLAVALLCTMSWTKCAPMDPNFTYGEAKSFVLQVNATAAMFGMICPEGFGKAIANLGLQRVQLDGSLKPRPFDSGAEVPKQLDVHPGMITMAEVALTLCSSGTTGRSKVVPLRLGQLMEGAHCIGKTLNLTESDVCLNAMPLFDIGGILCNLLGSLVAGGAVLCFDTTFNAETFVKCLSSRTPVPTWYYAVPSMHSAIMEFAHHGSSKSVPLKHSLRLCRHGAAALPPSLQKQLHEFWDCPVFASYSMRECTPIASAIADDPVQFDGKCSAPLGSVGRAVGPAIEIRGGQVMLRGSLVMHGYLGSDSGWLQDVGLFPTGDLGYVDEEGFLWLTGRCTEVINRAGETIALLEVEEALVKHSDIREMAVFGIPHQKLGETVAIAVVPKNANFNGFESLAIKICKDVRHPPALLAILEQLPRTSSGKVQRSAIYPALRAGGGPTELTGSEAGCIILDARQGGKRAPTCRYLGAEHGTVRAAFQENLEKVTEKSSRDSLGLFRLHFRRDALEERTIMQVYFLGVLAVNVVHLRMFGSIDCDQAEFGPAACNAFFRLAPAVQQALQLFSAHAPGWHMSLFFALTAYQDARHPDGRREFFYRDALMLVVILVLMCTYLVPHTWVADWPLLREHAARWYFHCILSARLFVVSCYKVGLGRIGQTVLAYPFALLWYAFLNLLSLDFTSRFGLEWGQGLGFLFTCLSDSLEAPKYVECLVAYILCYSWLPPFVEKLGRASPLTKGRQQLLGVMFWALFMVFSVVDWRILSQYPHEWIVYGCRGGQGSSAMTAEFCLRAPMLFGFPLFMLRGFLLTAAIALLPLTAVPIFNSPSLIGPLLAMPLTTCPSVRRLWLTLLAHDSPTLQLFTVLVVFTAYTSAAGLLFTTAWKLLQRRVESLWVLPPMQGRTTGKQDWKHSHTNT
mmetsp:Transcript_148921/g.263246  ORF Transcript_148921/g.263246 Transcript_148921/m.263246 type:complete len:1156 (+) Transcript_148921:59-3526(+)